MAQSRDAHTGSARSVNKHATVDVQGVAGDVAREVGRTARWEKSQLKALRLAPIGPTLIGGGDGLFREHKAVRLKLTGR